MHVWISCSPSATSDEIAFPYCICAETRWPIQRVRVATICVAKVDRFVCCEMSQFKAEGEPLQIPFGRRNAQLPPLALTKSDAGQTLRVNGKF
eukprot:8342094-Pyramimonas_sp.AAC.1